MKTNILRAIALLTAVITLALISPTVLAASQTTELTSTFQTPAAATTNTAATIAASGTSETAAATVQTSSYSESEAERFREEVLRLVNIERAKAGVPKLKAMKKLNTIADVRAQEASALFSHTRPNGKRGLTVFKEYSLSYKAAGENLARNYSTPESVVAAWMRSEAHRKNILYSGFKYIGIGYCVDANGKVFSSQLFYTPK